MQVSYNWLKEFVDIDMPAMELAELMTSAGVTIEHVYATNKGVAQVVVARVLEKIKHPEADKLNICQVTIDGQEKIQVVCGAPNVAEGQLVPFALVGASLPDGLQIKKAKLRGIESHGMICSAKELGIDPEKIPPEQKEGILVLPEDTPLGMDIVQVLGLDDYILELDLTPNRSDCLSVINIAREVGALLGKEVRLPVIDSVDSEEDIHQLASVQIEAPELCHRYTAKMVKGVTIKPSPFWMQHRLQCAGIRPINNIVDITNYVLMELGQPLHAFDYQGLVGHKIVIRNAKKDEVITTLDGQQRNLQEEMLLICDGAKAVAVAGVMGGENTEVTEVTCDVLIESAYFQPTAVRRTSTKLGLRSESSIRFEKGINIQTVDFAARRAAQLMQQLAGGTIIGGIIDQYPTVHDQVLIELPLKKVNNLLGTNITDERIKEILTGLQFVIIKDSVDMIQVQVPSYRPDCTIMEDLIEEVARVYGYDNIPQTLPYGASSRGQLTVGQKIRDRIQNKLVGLGLNEVINYSFINKNNDDKMGYAQDDIRRNSIPILNPLSEEQGHMRTSIIPGMIQTIIFNSNRRNDELAFFELGKVYLLDGKLQADKLADERWTLGIALKGKTASTWKGGGTHYDFYYLKGIVESLMAELNITDVVYIPCKDNSIYHPGRSAYIEVAGKSIGVFGELHPMIQDNYDMDGRSYVAEIDVDDIIAHGTGKTMVQLLPKFPSSTRDLAVVVKEDVAAYDIEKAIAQAASALLVDVKLFDVYQGNSIAAGNKSLAFALTFQADRTLTDGEVNEEFDNIYQALVKQFDAALRA